MGREEPPETRETARDRIYRVAARLYALRGYEGTSIREIAEAAGVTKPLVHYHFESKERLFSDLLDHAIGRCACQAAAIAARETGSAEKLRELIRAFAAEAREAPEIVCFAQEALTMPGRLPLAAEQKDRGRELFEIIVRLIAEGCRRGEFRQTDARHAAAVVIAAFGFVAVAVLAGDIKEVPADYGDFLFDLLWRGLEARAT